MLEQIKDFYNNKTVLVTGHTGFKGSWLALWLKSLGANVVGFSLQPEAESHYNLIGLDSEIVSIYGDIRDYNAFKDVFVQNNIEIVFHLAAQPLVRASYLDPINTYSSNVMGTVNLFEIVRAIEGVNTIVNVTTDKCYENKEWAYAYRENDELGGYDPYSSSKACVEIITSAFRRSFYKKSGIALASARAGNVIGGGDFSTDRIIPDVISSIVKNQHVVLRNPQSVRPWQHVFDALFGYLLLAMKLSCDKTGDYERAFNFSPKNLELTNVQMLIERFLEMMGAAGAYKVDKLGNEFHEANLLVLDPTMAITKLGWHPILNMESSLQFTADWYKSYISRPGSASMRAFSTKQIEDFMYLIRKEGGDARATQK